MPPEPSPVLQFVPLAIIFLIFYFLVIRPQQKKQQTTDQMQKALKKDDKVVTIGGVHGTVVTLKETTVVLRVDTNVKLEFDRDSIARLKKVD